MDFVEDGLRALVSADFEDVDLLFEAEAEAFSFDGLFFSLLDAAADFSALFGLESLDDLDEAAELVFAVDAAGFSAALPVLDEDFAPFRTGITSSASPCAHALPGRLPPQNIATTAKRKTRRVHTLITSTTSFRPMMHVGSQPTKDRCCTGQLGGCNY